jgi:molybdopterin converting factor small subunit
MDNIHITIKLFAMLREGHFDTKTGEFPVGTTVGEIIQQLGIPEKEVTLIFINGRHGKRNTQLVDGDTVALFPPVGGG